MAVKVGINGFGRIGRNVFRTALGNPDIEIVAVNDLTSPETLAHLLRYDSSQGRLGVEVRVEGNTFIVGDRTITVVSERDPSNIPWGELGVDVVVGTPGASPLWRMRVQRPAPP